MDFKYINIGIFLSIILLLGLTSVSSVDLNDVDNNITNAINSVNDGNIKVNDAIEQVNNATNEASREVDKVNTIMGNYNSNRANSFTSLYNTINSETSNTITFTSDYKYDISTDSGLGTSITISVDNKVLDFNNHVIDGLGSINFIISGSNVTIKNAIFTNNNINTMRVISWNGNNGHLIDSALLNCGGISWSGNESSLTNCIFINCHATDGGAVFWSGSKGTVSNSIFINSIASTSGGAVYWAGDNGVLKTNTFINSTASGDGGAVYWINPNGYLTDSVFINSIASSKGGAIYWAGNNGNLSNSVFTNSNSSSGGAVYWSATEGKLTNTVFINSTASTYGGAVHWYNNKGNIIDSTFKDSSASIAGGAIYWEGNNGLLSGNSNFISSSANYGGAIYWKGETGTINTKSLFLNSNANYHGGALYSESNNFQLNGDSTFINSNAISGGAIYLKNKGELKANSIFINSTASDKGGAIYWEGNEGAISTSSIFINSNASNGGAVYWEGLTGTLINALFINSSSNSTGGAVYWNGNNGILKDSTFINSNANNGGAIYWSSTTNTGSLTNSVFINNTASDKGGAIFLPYGLNISNSEFTNNQAFSGSAIYKNSHSDLNLVNVKFTNNKANSTSLNVKQEGEKYIATFTGYDNILNSIYNTGSYNTVKVNNTVISENPTSNNYYQSPLEANQNINAVVYDKNNNVLENKSLVTNLTGNVEFTPSTSGKLVFCHYEDSEYTFIASDVFSPINLSVVVDNKIRVNANTSFNISVSDFDDNPINSGTITINSSFLNTTVPYTGGVLDLNFTAPKDPGNYTINITYSDGSNTTYVSFNLTIRDTIDPNVTLFNKDNLTVGTYGLMNITDKFNKPLAAYNASVSINGSNITYLIGSDGSVNYILPNKTGKYEIAVDIYEDTELVGRYNDTITLIADYNNINLTIVNKDNLTVGGNGTLNVTDKYGNPLNDTIANVTIGNTTKEYLVNPNGTVDFELPDKTGDYNITVDVIKNGTVVKEYNDTIKILPDYTSINITILNKDNLTVGGIGTVNITDKYGNPLNGTTASIILDGNTTNSIVKSDGTVDFNLPLKPGTYPITVRDSKEGVELKKHDDNITLHPDYNNVNVNIINKDNLTVGRNGTLNVTDKYGNPLNDTIANVTIGNTTKEYPVNPNGTVDFELPTEPGKYNITVDIIKNGTVIKEYNDTIDVKIDYENVNVVIIDKDNLTVGTKGILNVTDKYGNPLSGLIASILLDGTTNRYTINPDGTVLFDLPNKADKYNITVDILRGNKVIKEHNDTITLIADYNEVKVSIVNKDNLTVKGNGTLNVTDKYGNPLNGTTVNVDLGDGAKNYPVGSDGTANFTLPDNPGKYNITVDVLDDGKKLGDYNDTIDVLPDYENVNVVIIDKDNLTVGTKGVLNVTDKFGNPLSGLTASILLDGSTKTYVINTDGTVLFDLPNKADKYNITVDILRNNRPIKQHNDTITLIADYNEVKVSIVNKDNLTVKGNGTLNVTDKYGNPLNGTTVNVDLANTTKQYPVGPDGTANFTLPDNPGKYPITVDVLDNGKKIGDYNDTIDVIPDYETANVVIMDKDNLTVGTKGVLNVTDKFNNPLAGLNADILLDGTIKRYVINPDGTVLFDLPLKADKYNVTVNILRGNNPIKEHNDTITLLPDYKNVNVTIIDKDNLTAGDNATLNITDKYGNPLNDTKVNVTIGNKTEEYPVNPNGTVPIDIPGEPGDYNVTVDVIKNDTVIKEHNDSIKVEPNVKVRILDKDNLLVNGNGTLLVTDKENNPLAGKKVNITLDNTTKEYTINPDGTVIFPLPSTPGLYPITTDVIDGDKVLGEFNDTLNVKSQIDPNPNPNPDPNPDSNLKDTNFIYGLNGDEVVLILVSNNTLVPGASVILSFGNYTGVLNTDNEAKVKLNISSFNPGTYTLTANYAGNNTYRGTTFTTPITIGSDINIDIDNNQTPGGNGTLNITDKDGNPLGNISVNITINNITKEYPVNNGTINFDLPTTPGIYNVTVDIIRNNTIIAEFNYTITIEGKNNITIINPDNLTEGGNGTLIVIIDFGDDLNNTVVNVTIGNETKQYPVGPNGTINFELPNGTGVFNITVDVIVNGTVITHYNDTIFIRSLNGTLISAHINGTLMYGTVNSLVGTLTNLTGDGLAGHHIAIRMSRLTNGQSKVYWVTTDYNGDFILPINLAPGIYSAEVNYYGELGYEGNSTGIMYFNISSHNTNLDVSFNGTMVYGDTNSLVGVLSTRDMGLAGHHIAVKLTRLRNGLAKIYWVTTDYLGNFILPINLAPGQYSAEVIYEGELGFTPCRTSIMYFNVTRASSSNSLTRIR